MTQPSLMILYVDNPAASAAFYADLLGMAPAEASETFAMFPAEAGMGLALWSRHTVAPAATAAGGGGEIVFMVGDVDAVHGDWAARGRVIAQPPTDQEFGRSFVALDPDGHRLRVMRPGWLAWQAELLKVTTPPALPPPSAR